MYRNIILSFTVLLFITPRLKADEGMWLPILMKEQKFADMRRMGLRLSAEEIYAVNRACLTDAVIGLVGEGGNLKSFCTASFVSDEGLIITNYHCVMRNIEHISTEENDFLRYGYWASKRSEETNCYNLKAKQLIRMEDVTERILKGTEGLAGKELTDMIDRNGRGIATEMTAGTEFEGSMQALFAGNQYIFSIYRVFEDIRMVAAPPTSLGRFGGDTDNWTWPRHTADFAFLRIYVDGENKPAKYSRGNVPYRPDKYLNISAKGYDENDFAMILGYPSSTMQYVPSFGIDRIVNGENKAMIVIGGEKMRVMRQAIEENPALRLRYFSRMSSVANKYLRLKGEVGGVDRMNMVEVKREGERQFREWAAQTPERRAEYDGVLDRMDSVYRSLAVYNLANDYFLDAGITGSEIVPFIGKFEKLMAIYARGKFNESAARSESRKLVGLTEQFFDNWDYEIDRRMFRNVMVHYWNDMPRRFIPEAMTEQMHKYGGDVEALSEAVFSNSIFTDRDALTAFLESDMPDGVGVIRNDALYNLAIGYFKVNVEKMARQRGALQAEMAPIYRLYQRGLLEMNSGKPMSPDANSSMRISYGRISGANPDDGLRYEHHTTLTGMRDKHVANPGEADYAIPRKLLSLYEAGDYGTFVNKEGEISVCFLTDCHTTSGNSGSPVVNARGELIGLNFDRIHQGVASDYRYDQSVCRSIAVDIRFVLFLIEKYAPEQYVLNELTVVL